MRVNTYKKRWLMWLALFAAIEIPASLNKAAGDTLSEQVWWLIGVGVSGPATSAVLLRRRAFLALWSWLTVHLFTGGWV